MTAKPEKTAKSKGTTAKAKKSGGVAALSPKQKKVIIMSAIALVLVIVLIVGIVVGAKSCGVEPKKGIPPFSSDGPAQVVSSTTVETDRPAYKNSLLLEDVDPDDVPQDAYRSDNSNTTAVGFHGEIKGTYTRVKPVAEIRDEQNAFNSEAMGDVFANGAKRYPTYGSTLKHVIGSGEAQTAARGALVSEGSYLAAWGTRGSNRGGEQTPDKYTKIDENGYLYQYKDNEWIHSLNWGTEEYSPENYRQLYKHTAAVGMYREGATNGGVTYAVADNAQAVIKEVQIRPRGYSSYSVTGLYAPAGEVIKIEMSGADMNATGGISVHIGQALYNGQANNIWVGKNQMQRLPHILTTLALNKSTCTYNAETDTWTGYVGSFVGGPIYIRNSGVNFTATVSGGLEYLHFILGYTTEEEFNRLKTTSKVPYFDLEVRAYGVLHSGPRYYAESFSYDNLYKAAVLWEKVAAVTTTGSNQGIVFIYDPFVAAGAAVAFPGRSSVNCPLGWMSQSLNYNSLVTSGSWGNFHEYHHNFQNYGLGSGADGETTNNGLTIVSYALFTKISSKRGIGSYGAQGLGGWNNYTSASWSLQRVLNGQISSTNGLAVYSTLLHNFGADAYTRARGARGANNYFNKWATVTHNDFTYYASLTNSYYNGGSNAYTPSAAVKDAKYPMFVPVSCVYQTGRSYMYDGQKKYFKTMQPYVISNKPFEVDLSRYTAPSGQYASGSVVIPDGFTYRIKQISRPANGSIELDPDDKFKLKYTPAAGAKTGSTSGQIVVTLEIVKNDGAFEVDDVDLILEFQISNETTKMAISRTTYTYTADKMYSDATAAYNANFAGSTSNVKQEQFNPTQNANTDIWFYPDTEENRNKYPNAPDKYFFHENNIEVIDGKIFFDEDGTYRVYLRGRDNCALYYSLDGSNYSLGAKITKDTPVTNYQNKNNSALFRPGAAETYFDVKFNEGKVYIKSGAAAEFSDTPVYTIRANALGEIDNWLHIKEVMIVDPDARSFIGVGMRQWTDPMFTQGIQYFRDEACTNEISADAYNALSDEEKDKIFTKTYYVDGTGKKVTEAEVLAAKSVPPTTANINGSQPYVNAYRNDYEFPDNTSFESEYFYVRSYNYNYVGTPVDYSTWDEGVSVISCNKTPWDNTTKIDNLLTSGQETYFHSGRNDTAAKGAMVLELDMGKSISANKITFFGRKPNAATTAQQGLPKNFSLEVSADGTNYTSAGTYTNSTGAAYSAAVNLDKTYEFRYVRITINSTHSNSSHFILSGIKFTYQFALTGNGANHISPDNSSVIFSGGNWKAEEGYSSFGQIYHGKSGSKVNFEFTGTRLAVLTSTLQDSSFEVWIDNKKVESIDVVPVTDGCGITYISQPLAAGKHKVEIRCTGDTYIDSFAIY